MTDAERKAVRELAERSLYLGGDMGYFNECDANFLARAVLAFVPGEVVVPAGWLVRASAVRGAHQQPLKITLSDNLGEFARLSPDDAIDLGHALVLAGMSAKEKP